MINRLICFLVGHYEEPVDQDLLQCRRCGRLIEETGKIPITLKSIHAFIYNALCGDVEIIHRCPDCHRIDRVFGRDIHPERHNNCIPF